MSSTLLLGGMAMVICICVVVAYLVYKSKKKSSSSSSPSLSSPSLSSPSASVTSCSGQSQLVGGVCQACVLTSGSYWLKPNVDCTSASWTKCPANNDTTTYALVGNTSTNAGSCSATCSAGRGTIVDGVCQRCSVLTSGEFWSDSKTCNEEIFRDISTCPTPANSTVTLTAGTTGSDVVAGTDKVCGFICDTGYTLSGGSCLAPGTSASSTSTSSSSGGSTSCQSYQRWSSASGYCTTLISGNYWNYATGVSQSPMLASCSSTSTTVYSVSGATPGTQTTAGSAGTCAPSSCIGHNKLVGGLCASCSLPNTSYYWTTPNGCDSTSYNYCSGSTRPNGTTCVAPPGGQYWSSTSGLATSNFLTCPGNTATSVYSLSGSSIGSNVAAGSAGSCVVSSCLGRNQLVNGVCTACPTLPSGKYWSNASDCTSASFTACPASATTTYTVTGNSAGTATSAGNAGSCVANGCVGRYRLSNGTCVACPALAANQYWSSDSGCSTGNFTGSPAPATWTTPDPPSCPSCSPCGGTTYLWQSTGATPGTNTTAGSGNTWTLTSSYDGTWCSG